MRFITLLLIWMFISFIATAQKVNYTIPQGYENEINKADYKKIVDLAIPIVARRYTIDFVKDGAIHLNSGQEMQTLNLHNLIMKCIVVEDKLLWDKVIDEHFTNLFASIDEQKNIDPENYESIKKYLSLRIYPVESVQQRGGAANLITRIDLEGTYTVLMLDLPGAFAAVQKTLFELWKKDHAEVFNIAQQHINQQPIEKVTKAFDIDGVTIQISFLGNEDYAASYALDIMHNSPELVGEWGTVLAFPNKGLVNICKVSRDKPLDFVKFIQATQPLIERSFREHPQPISNQYFWYYNGTFTRIHVKTDAQGNINVISPLGLTELMSQKK